MTMSANAELVEVGAAVTTCATAFSNDGSSAVGPQRTRLRRCLVPASLV